MSCERLGRPWIDCRRRPAARPREKSWGGHVGCFDGDRWVSLAPVMPCLCGTQSRPRNDRRASSDREHF